MDPEIVTPLSDSAIADVQESDDGPSRHERMTLRALSVAALGACVIDAGSDEEMFLYALVEQVVQDSGSWRDALGRCLEQPHPTDVPLLRLAQTLELTVPEILTVALATAVEDDLMVGRAIARLQAPVGGSRPTLGLLGSAFRELLSSDAEIVECVANGAAVRSGLLHIIGDGAPLAERAVAVPVPFAFGFSGKDGTWTGTSIGLPDDDEVPLPPSIARAAERHAGALAGDESRALLLRTGSESEGKSVAAAICVSLRKRPLFIDTDKLLGIGPWIHLRRFVPVFVFDLGPGERRILPAIPSYNGPVIVLCGPDGSVEARNRNVLSWPLPVPPQEEREALWLETLGEPGVARQLSRHHRHGTGRIAQLGRQARHGCAIDGRSRPTLDDLVAASRAGEGAGLDALAQPLLNPIPDDALVVPPMLRDQLENLLRRCRARDELVLGLGPSSKARYSPGVRALFVGPSGTGKTIAGCWLATKLGLPLYRVDLAAVTSKYIGETEKNLSQLLARAEQAEIVLLFDEADSMFGKRTEVREANDRFANAQTNYLLQRIETYDGITILTSNSRTRFDPAFSRRLDLMIDFPLPGPEERRSLWQSHLGGNHGMSMGELNRLAATADMTGGQIRNAVLEAAVLAQDQGRPISYGDVLHGLSAEYQKLGRQVPIELTTGV